MTTLRRIVLGLFQKTAATVSWSRPIESEDGPSGLAWGDLACFGDPGPSGLPKFWGWEAWGATWQDDGSIEFAGEFGTIVLPGQAYRRWEQQYFGTTWGM